MLKGFSMRFVRDRRMIRFGRRWNTTHVASEVPAAHHHADENGMTALHWEAKKDCPDVVKSLVDAGADIEARNSLGRSPLLVACENGNFAQVTMLVEAGASVCATDKKKETCLTLAAHNGHTETVRYLVGLPEVDVDQPGRDHYTALHSAVSEGHPDVVKVLIDAGADIKVTDHVGRTLLFNACSKGILGIVKMLVEAGADFRENGSDSCLTFAADHGHTQTVRYLAGLPEALLSAARKGHSDVVQMLIAAGADMEAKDRDRGRSPLHWASSEGKLSTVKLLVEAGASMRATVMDGDMCLILAARHGHAETVRYLVGLPEVDVQHRNEDDFTALDSAVMRGHPDVVQVLIDAGADINTDFPPLEWWIAFTSMPIERTGAATLLHRAVNEGHTDVVQVLIEAGADIEAKNDKGCSPLHWACEDGRLAIVMMLVKAGAKVCATDNEGNTCFTIAQKNGHTNIVRYLEKLRDVKVKQTDRLGNATGSSAGAGHCDTEGCGTTQR